MIDIIYWLLFFAIANININQQFIKKRREERGLK